jgi:hypothetical protein
MEWFGWAMCHLGVKGGEMRKRSLAVKAIKKS